MANAAEHERREIWFLTGSQHLYGEATLEQVAQNSRAIAESLDRAEKLPVKVVWKPVLTGPEAIETVCLAANSAPECAGVITWMHTFSPAKMWIAGLTRLQKPLAHLHTQFNRELPWGAIDMDFMNLNQSAHGDREFGFIGARLRLKRKVVVGHFQDAEVVDELAAAVDQAPDDRINDTVADYEAAYDLGEPLRRGGARHDELRYAARIEVALRSFLEDGGFGAFTDTFEDLGELRQLPGIAVQRLMADGYGFGAEGDWKAGALVRILKVMAEGLSGGTSFMEDYTYHLGDPVPEVLGAHMLEVCPSIANGHVSCEIHPLSIGGRSDPVRLVFDAAPGPAVILGLADLGRRFRLISSTVDIVEPDAPLPALPVARAVWRPRPDLATAAEAWLTAGGPHHTALTTALPVEPIEDFAEIADIELVSIDAATTVPTFRRELRWNQAYYHLRGGI